MGSGGKKKGGGFKKAAGGARKAAKSTTKTVSHAAKSTAKTVNHQAHVGAKTVGRQAKATSKTAGRAYHSASNMAKRTGGDRFHIPSLKDRKFPTIRTSDMRMIPTITAHHRRQSRASRPTNNSLYYSDPYYRNSRYGYYTYDDRNSYHHRRYGRSHNYTPPRPPVESGSSVEVTYDSLRVSLPPDSANFCFIPISTLSMAGMVMYQPEESKAQEKEIANLKGKVLSLLCRSYSVDGSSMSSLCTTATELLNQSGALLRGMARPEQNGWYIPDWLCYGCCVGKSKQQRIDEFVENEMEETADKIIVLWNKDGKISARGISATYVDIGNSFTGIILEVLPFVQQPGSSAQGTSAMVPNPHLLRAPNAPAVNYTSAEIKALELISQARSGVEIKEEDYDNVFSQATSDLNTQLEKEGLDNSVLTDSTTEMNRGGEPAKFVVVSESYFQTDHWYTVVSPEGVFYTFLSPGSCNKVVITPGQNADAEIKIEFFTAYEDNPPPYSTKPLYDVFFDEKDTTVPPSYSESLQHSSQQYSLVHQPVVELESSAVEQKQHPYEDNNVIQNPLNQLYQVDTDGDGKVDVLVQQIAPLAKDM